MRRAAYAQDPDGSDRPTGRFTGARTAFQLPNNKTNNQSWQCASVRSPVALTLVCSRPRRASSERKIAFCLQPSLDSATRERT
jgi:hypothetical protein